MLVYDVYRTADVTCSLYSEAQKREALTQSPLSSVFVLLALATLLQVVEAQGEPVCGCTYVRACVRA